MTSIVTLAATVGVHTCLKKIVVGNWRWARFGKEYEKRWVYVWEKKRKISSWTYNFTSHSCFFQMSTQIVFIITHPLEANTACAGIKLVQQIINGRSENTALCALEEHTQHLGHENFSGKYMWCIFMWTWISLVVIDKENITMFIVYS